MAEGTLSKAVKHMMLDGTRELEDCWRALGAPGHYRGMFARRPTFLLTIFFFKPETIVPLFY